MQRVTLLFAAMGVAMLLASGVAWAATINCPNRAGNLCVGTDNRDTMYGTSAKDVMRGLDAADTLRARAGADQLTGGGGDDTLGGGRGSDVYRFGADSETTWGVDHITSDESSGVDTLDFTALHVGVLVVDLVPVEWRVEARALRNDNNWGRLDIASGVVLENVRGSSQVDQIEGNDSPNHFWGYGASDLLIGWAGNDVLDGGAQRDTLEGATGDDTIYAIDGYADTIYCGDGNDTVHYDQGLDTFFGSSTPDASCETTLTQ
jgi:Ca2+-binding RTX toxin-like protein